MVVCNFDMGHSAWLVGLLHIFIFALANSAAMASDRCLPLIQGFCNKGFYSAGLVSIFFSMGMA